jgi:glycine/D-amino acid oxidase-like deaminating enzyme
VSRLAASRRRIAIAGSGVFGAAAALELRRRGWEVVLLDPEAPPAPRAASTDVSKVVRREYGSDGFYLELAAAAIDGWRRWNAEWPEPLYHESGLLVIGDAPLAAAGFVGDSWRSLLAAGCSPEPLDGSSLAARFPAWRGARAGGGFFHRAAGWAESGRVVARLVELARDAGVEVRREGVVGLLVDDRGVRGVRTPGGALAADHTLLAAGVWTPRLAGLEWGMWPTAHPVFHLAPADPEPFRGERFPVFMSDIAATGWYGFPLHPREGVVKVARHGLGRRVEPDVARTVTEDETRDLRAFLASSLPGLAGAPVVASRSCLYCDTADGHFWIDRDPAREGLTVASGGSGHAFKFAPLLGGLIADAVEGRTNPWLPRFAWRREARPFASEEQARAGRS